MPTNSPSTAAAAIPVPDIDSDEPLAAIPLASVAPLDGPPDGERINTFALAPKYGSDSLFQGAGAQLRGHVLRKPLASMAAAFSLGYLLARMLR